MTADTSPLLVLVHPGSACGSADFNIGKVAARCARDDLCRELDSWQGALVVIDGELSDELSDRPALQSSIDDALARAQASPFGGLRVMGSDPEQVDCIREVALTWGPTARERDITVTGAWFHPEDGSGCVGSVIQALRDLGFKATVSAHAVCLASEDDADAEHDAGHRGRARHGPG